MVDFVDCSRLFDQGLKGGGGRRFGHGYNHGENQRTNHWYVDHIQRKTSKLIHFWGKLWIKGWKHCFNHIQIKKHLIQFNFIEYTKMFNLIIRKKNECISSFKRYLKKNKLWIAINFNFIIMKAKFELKNAQTVNA